MSSVILLTYVCVYITHTYLYKQKTMEGTCQMLDVVISGGSWATRSFQILLPVFLHIVRAFFNN